MDRNELQEQITKLAEIAKNINEPSIAVVLYTLSGSIIGRHDSLLAGKCKDHSREMIKLMNEIKSSSLN